MPAKLYGKFDALLPTPNRPKNLRVPLLYLSLANDSDWKQTKAGLPKIAVPNLVGLIDTGSDVCRIDASIAKQVNLPKITEVDSIAADGLTTTTNVYYGQLCFPQIGLVFEAQMPSGPFRQAENFDAILGMDFLRLFIVRIYEKSEIVDLEFVGQ